VNPRHAKHWARHALIVALSACLASIVLSQPAAAAAPISDALQPDAEWETYVDTVYGYSIQYPRGWYVSPTPPDAAGKGGLAQITNYDPGALNYKKRADSTESSLFKLEIGILNERRPASVSPSAWINEQTGQVTSANENSQEIRINGVTGVKTALQQIDCSQEQITHSRVAYLVRGDITYFVYATTSDVDTLENIYDTVLYSFKLHDSHHLDSIELQAHGISADQVRREPNIRSSTAVTFRLPFDGTAEITQGPYGKTSHCKRSLEAIDFALVNGHTVYTVLAAEGGQVVFANWDGTGFGHLILIRHAGGLTSYYAHLSKIDVAVGQSVLKGQPIGLSGNSGGNYGYHLHFEVRKNVVVNTSTGVAQVHSGEPVWVRDIPGITWRIEGNQDCPCPDFNPCSCDGKDDGKASSNFNSNISFHTGFEGICDPAIADRKHVKFKFFTTEPPKHYYYSTASGSTVPGNCAYTGELALIEENPGRYNVLIKGPTHLQQLQTVDISDGKTYNWANIPLQTGDVNNDNQISTDDIALVLSKYTDFTVPVSTGTPEDLNSDNQISVDDVALSLSNYTDFVVYGDDWDDVIVQQVQKNTELENIPSEQENRDKFLGYEQDNSTVPATWSWPINISRSSGNSEVPAGVSDSDGIFHTVWSEAAGGSYRVAYASRSDAKGWSAPVGIPSSIPGVYPAIAVDEQQTLHVVWQTGELGLDIYYAYKLKEGAWSAPVNVSNTPNYSLYPNVAVGEDGTVHVAWLNYTSGSFGDPETFYTAQAPGSGWSKPVNISNDSHYSSKPRIAIDDTGRAHVVWEGGGIWYSSKSADGAWSSPLDIAAGVGGSEPALAIDSAGIVHVTWRANDSIRYANNANRAWTTSQQVSSGGGFSPQIVAKDGSIQLAWAQAGEIWYAKKNSVADPFTAPVNVSGNFAGAFSPALAVDPFGRAHVAWRDDSSGNLEINYTFAIPGDGIVPLRLVPNSASLPVGEDFPVEIRFNTKGVAISAIAIELTYSYAGATPDLEVSPVQVDRALIQTGGTVSVNDVSTESGTVTIHLAMLWSGQNGYSTTSDTLLGTINLRANQPFTNKTLSFSRVETKIPSKVDAIDFSQLQETALYTAFSDGQNSTPTPTSTPTSVQPTATPTLTPTNSAPPLPTHTPTAVSSPVSTATSVPTATPTLTPTSVVTHPPTHTPTVANTPIVALPTSTPDGTSDSINYQIYVPVIIR